MKQTLLATTLILSAAATANANPYGDDNWPYWYIGLNAGGTYQTSVDVKGVAGVTELDPEVGYSIGGSIGHRLKPSESVFGNDGKIELEASVKSQDLDNTSGGEIKADVFVLSYIEEINNYGSQTQPYLGAGLGYASIEADGTNATGDDDAFIYQLQLGVSYEPRTIKNTAWKLGYKYLGTFNDPEISTGEIEYDNHTIEAGAEFRF